MNFKRKRRSEGACLTIDDSTLLASISFSFGIKFLYLLLSIHIIYYLRNVIFLIKLKIRWKFSKNFYSDLINQTFLFWVNIYIYIFSFVTKSMNHQPRIIVPIAQNQSYRFLERNDNSLCIVIFECDSILIIEK